MERFTKEYYPKTKYLFFTGKGGVGKTSVASSLSLELSDEGKKVLLVSTDPASNLQDIFSQTLTNKPMLIDGTTSLYALNLDPIMAAEEYKNKMVEPFRGKLPDAAIQSIEEQMSGACTVEIAAFNEFSSILTDQEIQKNYDVIIFDTVPTGHTLRLLQLPMAWSGFLAENSTGTSCLGPLAGLEGKKEIYKKTVNVLADTTKTTLILVSRPENNPLKEASRASEELFKLGIHNQQIIMNGMFESNGIEDANTKAIVERQNEAITEMPAILHNYPIYSLPLAPFSITSIEKMHTWFTGKQLEGEEIQIPSKTPHTATIHQLVDEYMTNPKSIIFTMGKGGVGKTTVATLIALGLAENGQKVHLTTTDPAAHIGWVLGEECPYPLTISSINPEQVLAEYKKEVLSKAQKTMNDEGLLFIKEDLESPCTEEIAVFRAFANIIEEHRDEVVVIDTAPTGHTLLLLDASEAYHKEIRRASGEVPISIQHLLPTLRNHHETSVVITTLPEATPVYEAERLQQDLERAGLTVQWWMINQTFSSIQSNHPLLNRKGLNERKWIERVDELSHGNTVCIPWSLKEPKGIKRLHNLLSEGK